MTMSTLTPIWLDCDTGHDDAFAILLAAHHPSSQLLGISTVFGNAPLAHTTNNTRAILTAIGRAEGVPVYPGAGKPFCRSAAHSPEIHGETGLDGTTCLPSPTVPAQTEKAAVQAMYEALIATPKGTAWLVATGALTNVALLFAVHPDLVAHLGGISIMGGAVGGGFTDAPMGTVKGLGERFGNTTPFAEFNIYIDPEAAKAVISDPEVARKTTLVPLDLTHLFLASKNIVDGLLEGFDAKNGPSLSGGPSVVRKLFVEILTFFAMTYADVFNITDGPPLHDPLAVAAAFAPALFDDRGGERFSVDIVIDDPSDAHSQLGRTKVQRSPAGQPGVRIPRGLDNDRIWRMLDSCLGLAEASLVRGS